MPADLKVVAVRLPPRLRAPCPLVLQVSVENVGNDAADPVPYDVTIELGGAEGPGSRFEATVTTPEEQRLTPGRIIDVPVTVSFPCLSPVMLRATVDARQQIPNNARSAPSLTLTGLTPRPVPWLRTALTVGISDATGLVTTDPGEFCPGKAIVAEVSVSNDGCAPSKPCKTEVSLEDANAIPFPVTLATAPYLLPAVAPGGIHRQTVSLVTPSSTAGLSGALGVHVLADADVANPEQCDRSRLDARIVTPFTGSGGAPRLSLTLDGGGVLRPGQEPVPTWSLRNECSEIGLADVRILFGTPPTVLYSTRVAIPLRATVGERFQRPLAIPPAVANTFWAFGLKSLELEVTGSGSAGGPYQASAPVNVVPEAVDDSWWAWGSAPTGVWKSSYVVTGGLTNRGVSALTLSALSALEHPTDVVGTAQDQDAPAPGATGTTVAPGSTAPAAWVRRQGWQWLLPVTFVETGPRSRTFSYTASYALTDAFGNTYLPTRSTPVEVGVAVSQSKLDLFGFGTTVLNLGLSLFAAAAIVAATVPYPAGPIIAGLIALAAAGFVIWGTLYLRFAIDPPVPDFGHREPMLVDPRAWKLPEVEDERYQPLSTLALLVARVVAAQARVLHASDRAWAAYVDGAEDERVQYRDAALAELETLRRLVKAVVNAADEAEETFEQLLDEVRDVPSPKAIRDVADQWVDQAQPSEVERSLVLGRLEVVDEEALRRSVEQARSDGLRTAAETVRRLYELLVSEFAEAEHLR